MPEICRFFGVFIQMFYDDHAPPHFHVRYSDQRALIAIETLAVLKGRLSPGALGLVTEWAALHHAEQMEDWNLARAEAQLRPIAPLEWKMLKDVVEARALEGYRLQLRFEDGVEGVVNLGETLSFRGVFAALKDPAFFAQVRVDAGLGTVTWPNGADIDPDVLYSRVSGTPILLAPADALA
jgi:hypothetical protein